MSAILYSTTAKTHERNIGIREPTTAITVWHLIEPLSSLTQRDVSGHAEGDCLGKGRGLGEEVQVVEGKDELDWFVHLNSDLQTGI